MARQTAKRRAQRAVVSADHHLASSAGLRVGDLGGNAVDMAVAAAAAMSVVSPHSSGTGGDLFALVHGSEGAPVVLEAVGRAGSGADADGLRSEGKTAMPRFRDVRSVTVPGCVDGWLALNERHGALPVTEVLRPAIELASEGFPVSSELRAIADRIDHDPLTLEVFEQAGRSGWVRRPNLAATLAAVADAGRDGFYRGPFGDGLVAMAPDLFSADDLATSTARWVEPLCLRMWDHDVWVPPPPSQAFVLLAAGWIAQQLDLPDDAEDSGWVHLLSEAVCQAACDRRDVLHEAADGSALLDPARLSPRAAAIDPDRRSASGLDPSVGCTTYLCATDEDGMGVSLIQSIASSFGSHLTVPGTGVVLHNRGRGFSLEPGHPAEYGPGRRPPHTLSPSLVTTPEGSLRALVGTRGADAQPQVVLQVLARLLRHRRSPADALQAPRWLLASPDDDAFETWRDPSRLVTRLESHAPAHWSRELADRGHDVRSADRGDAAFGSVHVISVEDGESTGSADPRTVDATRR